MPNVREGETKESFMKRAMPYMIKKEGLNKDQAAGKALGMYRSHKRKGMAKALRGG